MKVKVSKDILTRIASGKKGMGLGDIFARVSSALGIAPCDGCKSRQKSLNRFKVKW